MYTPQSYEIVIAAAAPPKQHGGGVIMIMHGPNSMGGVEKKRHGKARPTIGTYSRGTVVDFRFRQCRDPLGSSSSAEKIVIPRLRDTLCSFLRIQALELGPELTHVLRGKHRRRLFGQCRAKSIYAPPSPLGVRRLGVKLEFLFVLVGGDGDHIGRDHFKAEAMVAAELLQVLPATNEKHTNTRRMVSLALLLLQKPIHATFNCLQKCGWSSRRWLGFRSSSMRLGRGLQS